MAHNDYAVVIADLNSVPLAEVPHKNLQYSYTLNAPGSVNFTLPTLHPLSTREVIEPGQREIHIYRSGERVWGGYLWGVSVESSAIRLAGEGYFSRFSRRTISDTTVFTSIDQTEIAWELISYSQSVSDGGLGITRPVANPSGVLRSIVYNYWERKKINEAITDLSKMSDGFDFEINAQKEWWAYYPQKGVQTDVIGFEYGKNVSGLYYEYDAGKLSNEVTGVGLGDGPNSIFSVYSDDASRISHKLLQSVVSWKDVAEPARLDELTQAELEVRKTARQQPQIQVYTDDPPFGAYAVGDRVRIKANHGYMQIDDYFRILSIVVAVANSGRDAIGVYFDEVGDA